MQIIVTSPIYITNFLHQQFVNFATRSIMSADHEVIFIPVENRIDPDFSPFKYLVKENIQVISVLGEQPQSCAKGWNVGIRKGRELGAEYILVINDDIILKSNAIDRLVARAEAETDPDVVMWSMGQWGPDPSENLNLSVYDDVVVALNQCPEDENTSEHPNFSAYMVKSDFFDMIGEFDRNIEQGYYEDNLCHARIALLNKKAIVYGGARFFHYGSRTINSDIRFREEMPPIFNKNAEYFRQMWGEKVDDPERMRQTYYKHPYNIPELSITQSIPDYWSFLEKHGARSIHDLDKQAVLEYLKEKGVL